MSSDSVFGDELMLYALARTYSRHVVVFTQSKCWTTVGTDDEIPGKCLLEICDIKLVYIGNHMFGELHRKPYNNECKLPVTEAPIIHVCNTSDEEERDAVDLHILKEKSTCSSTNKTLDIYSSDQSGDEQDNTNKPDLTKYRHPTENTYLSRDDTEVSGINMLEDPLLSAVLQ